MIIHPKFIFAHIPKTGGTFVQQFLMKYMQFAYKTKDKHISLTDVNEAFDHEELANILNELSDDFLINHKSFTFIRNPFDWYMRLWTEKGYWEELSDIEDFKEFVVAIFNKDKGKPHPWADFEFFNKHDIGLYTYAFMKIVCDYEVIFENIEKNIDLSILTSEHIFYDEIYKTENLRSDLLRALEFCDIKLPEFEKYTLLNSGKVDVSDSYKDYRYYYDDELLNLVSHKDRILIDLFDYKF